MGEYMTLNYRLILAVAAMICFSLWVGPAGAKGNEADPLFLGLAVFGLSILGAAAVEIWVEVATRFQDM